MARGHCADRRQNAGHARQWQLTDWWQLNAGYAYLDGKVTRSNHGIDGKRIGDLPEHSFTGRTNVTIPGTPVTLRGGINHIANRVLVDGSDVVLPAYTLADIGVGVDLKPVLIDATLSNLFDERFFTASGNGFVVYPGEPCTFSVRLRAHTRSNRSIR